MGAITMNVWVGAILFDPVEEHMKKVVRKCTDMTQMLEFQRNGEQDQFEDFEQNNVCSEFERGGSFKKSASSATVRSYKSPTLLNQTRNLTVPKRDRKISAPIQRNIYYDSTLSNQVCSTSALHSIPEKIFDKECDFLTQSNLHNNYAPHKSTSFTSSFQYISTPYHGSLLSIKPENITNKNVTNKTVRQIDQKSKLSSKSYFDMSLLKDPLYLIILISNSTNAISYTNFVILLPAYAVSMEFDKSRAALLISTVSAFDLIGRICGSALSDLGFCPKHWYFVGGLFFSGVSLTLLTLAESYFALSIICGIFGLASGVYVGVTAVIMADMLGTERLVSSYGISLFVNGILQLIGPPICGLWYEQTNSYVSLFRTLGLILLFGTSIWAYVPFIKRRNPISNSRQ